MFRRRKKKWHEKNPKLDPKGPKNLDPKETLEMFESEYESPIEKRIKNNILKAEQNQLKALTPEEFKKLPKPAEILKIAKGPLKQNNLETKQKIIDNLKNQLNLFDCQKPEKVTSNLQILLGLPNSGLLQIGKILHQNYGDFVLIENLLEPKEVSYVLENLQKCVIVTQENVLKSDLKNSSLACNSHILNICDENCLKSPSLLSELCEFFPRKTLILDQIKIENLNFSQVLYLYRDPRAMIKEQMDQLKDPKKFDIHQEAQKLCQSMEQDLDFLKENPDIQKLRFEDFALKPTEDHLLLKSYNYCQIHLETLDFKALVDSWKFKFSMEEIMGIEDACNNVLNVLEYPIYGSNLINSAE